MMQIAQLLFLSVAAVCVANSHAAAQQVNPKTRPPSFQVTISNKMRNASMVCVGAFGKQCIKKQATGGGLVYYAKPLMRCHFTGPQCKQQGSHPFIIDFSEHLGANLKNYKKLSVDIVSAKRGVTCRLTDGAKKPTLLANCFEHKKKAVKPGAPPQK